MKYHWFKNVFEAKYEDFINHQGNKKITIRIADKDKSVVVVRNISLEWRSY